MSFTKFPPTVRILLILSLVVLLAYFLMADRDEKKQAEAGKPKNLQETADRLQNSQDIAVWKGKDKETKKVNSPQFAAPQPSAQDNLSRKSLQSANVRPRTEKSFGAADDPYSIKEEFQQTLQLAEANKSDELQMLGQRAIRISTDLALELFNQIPSRREQLAFLKGILSQLLAYSPKEAGNWTEQYLGNDMKETAFGLIGELYAAQDPSEAANWASGIENPALRIKAYESIALIWGESDINSAFDWAMLIEDYGEQDRVFLKLGEAIAKNDPQAAADWALTFDDQALGSKILGKAINKWSMGNLPEAARWAAELPDSMYKTFAVSQISSLWGQFDPPTSFDWAYALPNGEIRDLALDNITAMWSKNDPAKAADRVLSIEDSPLRLKMLSRVIKIWKDKAPQALVLWGENIQDPKKRSEVEQLLQP